MNRVEPEPIEAKVAQPIERVLDSEPPHFAVLIIDRIAPRRVGLGEKLRRVSSEIISLRSEVVVDDVEKHHEAALMRGVDQRLEIVGPAIGAVRGVKQDAVVAPVPASKEIGDRHQLDRGEACVGNTVELVDDAAKRAVFGECADMQLQEDALVPGPAFPVARLPVVGLVDHLARPVHVLGLEA
jgi:hypothetical protein